VVRAWLASHASVHRWEMKPSLSVHDWNWISTCGLFGVPGEHLLQLGIAQGRMKGSRWKANDRQRTPRTLDGRRNTPARETVLDEFSDEILELGPAKRGFRFQPSKRLIREIDRRSHLYVFL